MNIENDFLTDFDLFGKNPELYYKGKSKKSSTLGIVLTILYIILYFTFLIYKLIRMFKRVDVTFYDSYSFNGIPSMPLTNNEFYGGFGMGGIVDEKMYYLTVDYVSKVRVNGDWTNKTTRLETEICQLEKFGPDYREIFADKPLKNYYCIKDVSGMVLEGYSNLERFSFFNVKFYPCVGTTKDGEPCYDDAIKEKFFTFNSVELKIQDNDLNPLDYKNPVLRRKVDMNSPVFKGLFQLIYSYLQIVNIETDEDITGLNFFSNNIRKQTYTRYDESFIIASPLLYGDILLSGGPVADVTLQLAAKVLTEKRQYTQLIDVLGDVGGLMEIIYTFLNIISSFITEVLYDKSLVNNLFSFELNKKYVVFNDIKNKIKKSEHNHINLHTINKYHSNQKFEELEKDKNIEIYSKENSNQIMIPKNIVSSDRKKIKKKKGTSRKSSKTNIQIKEQSNIHNEEVHNNENKVSIEENKNIENINNIAVEPIRISNDSYTFEEKDLKNVYINSWLICYFWCTRKKKNMNKILFEEGSKIITERLDIMNMFKHLYIIELIQNKLYIETKGINMSDVCQKCIDIYNANNFNKNIK